MFMTKIPYIKTEIVQKELNATIKIKQKKRISVWKIGTATKDYIKFPLKFTEPRFFQHGKASNLKQITAKGA